MRPFLELEMENMPQGVPFPRLGILGVCEATGRRRSGAQAEGPPSLNLSDEWVSKRPTVASRLPGPTETPGSNCAAKRH